MRSGKILFCNTDTYPVFFRHPERLYCISFKIRNDLSGAIPLSFKASATIFARFSDKVILILGLPVSLSAYPVMATCLPDTFPCMPPLHDLRLLVFLEKCGVQSKEYILFHRFHYHCHRFRFGLFHDRLWFRLFYYWFRFIIYRSCFLIAFS